MNINDCLAAFNFEFYFFYVTVVSFVEEMFHIVYFIYFIYYIDMDIKNTSAKSIFLTAYLYFSLNSNHYFHKVTVGHFVAENSVCDLLLIFMAIFTLFRFFIETCQLRNRSVIYPDSTTVGGGWMGIGGGLVLSITLPG